MLIYQSKGFVNVQFCFSPIRQSLVHFAMFFCRHQFDNKSYIEGYHTYGKSGVLKRKLKYFKNDELLSYANLLKKLY